MFVGNIIITTEIKALKAIFPNGTIIDDSAIVAVISFEKDNTIVASPALYPRKTARSL